MIKSIISIAKKFMGENKEENDKVICGCFNITEQDLVKAVNGGAKSFEEVQAITKVGTGCGNCIENNKTFIHQLLLNQKIDENPVVCGCFNVRVQDVVKSIKNGAKSFEEVQAVTKIGTGCGKCIDSNRVLVAQLLAKQSA